MGVIVIQGYGSTECGFATCTTREDHGLGTVGRSVPPVEVRLADDGEILVRGPNVFRGYWHDEAATAAALSDDGWYRTGDIGRFDADGRLILMGRNKDIIVLPNGFNVYPEDIENALRMAGIRNSVVVETQPGRIEAIVLAPGSHGLPQGGDIPAAGPGAAEDPALVRGQHRREHQGRQPDPRGAPAGVGLAPLARRRLPADPHPQGEARPDPRLGRGRRTAAGAPGVLRLRAREGGLLTEPRSTSTTPGDDPPE